MGNLANSYSDLGRHEEALAMMERVLEFDRSVLPENHPDIGEGHVRRGDCMRLVDCDATCFADCDAQAWRWGILPGYTPNSEGTRKRLR